MKKRLRKKVSKKLIEDAKLCTYVLWQPSKIREAPITLEQAMNAIKSMKEACG